MRKRTKTDAFDWAAIRWARLREENESIVEPRLDPPKNERGRLVDPIGFLSERAGKILSDAGISAAQLRERVLAVWFFSLIFVAALGAFVFPFARADRLLGNGVNLAGPFVFFLLGQIFFLATSLIFVLVACFQSILRKFRKQDAPRTFAEKTVERFCGLVGWLALVGLRRGLRWLDAFVGERSERGDARNGRRFFWKSSRKKDSKADNKENENGDASNAAANATADDAPSQNANEKSGTRRENDAETTRNSNARRTATLFWDSIFEKPRFLFFWGGVLSHLFWASCSICVLLILVVRMQGNRYDYRWHTSLEDERVVKKCVDVLGAPIAKLGVAVPTEEDVNRLFVDDRPYLNPLLNPTGDKANAPIIVVLDSETNGEVRQNRRMETQTRALWSRFLLSVVFVWCVAPRCLLVGVNYLLLRRSLRDFRPDLRDPYFKKAIDREESYSTTTRAAVVYDAFDDETKPENETTKNDETIVENETTKIDETNPENETTKNDETIVENETTKIALALGYDATISPERWRDLLDAAPTTALFDDVAADFDAKKRFRNWTKSNGANVALCVVATDVGLSPARHCVKFLRDDLGAALPNAQIFVVLSGGEKLRRKYGATTVEAVEQRLEDWRGVIANLSKTTGVSFTPIFFFDAEIDLPEERARLRRLLTNALNDENAENADEVDETETKNFAKWNAAAEKIDREIRRIFDENEKSLDEAARDERDRRRTAQLCAEIFAIYREETDAVAANGADESRRFGFDAGAFSQQLSKIGENAAEELGAFGRTLSDALADNGVGAAALEKKLTQAFGLSAKMRGLCKNLSPKCALAVGAVGVSAPIVAAFAPLFGGALTATAVASTLGSLGALLPTAVASGATGAALGAFAPTSLSACKKKIVEKWRRGRESSSTPNATNSNEIDVATDSETPNDGIEKRRAVSNETLESVAVVACGATTWAVALELQGWSEEKIVAALPVATQPLETSPLDAPETVRQALAEIETEIRRLRERNATNDVRR